MVVPRRGKVAYKGSSVTTRSRSQRKPCVITRTRDFKQKQRSIQERNSTQKKFVPGRGRQVCDLEVRDFGREERAEERSILSWLIDSGTVRVNGRVCYMSMGVTVALCQGRITRNGIVCRCCHETMEVSEFEVHAGSKIHDPYRNIFLDTGINLLKCQSIAWFQQGESMQRRLNEVKGHENASDQNDDTCGLCGDGGDLICCDGCPSTFHLNCLGLWTVPQGDWLCPNCICKFCGRVGCDKDRLLACYQCDRKYHQNCSWEAEGRKVAPMFCGMNCRNLFQRLQNRIGVKLEIGDGYSWSLLRRSEPIPKESVHMETKRITCNSKLAIVNEVMKECFDSLVDERSGVNIIQSVVFNCGSNLNRLNFSRFYTAVLEKDGNIISAASIRIHGSKLAEMPFIVTRYIYRRQGMCRRLLNAIESTLKSLGVQYLIIPSVKERVPMWTELYDFEPIDEALKEELKSTNYLTFPSTDLLQKVPMSGSKKRNGTTSPKNGTRHEENALFAAKLQSNSRRTILPFTFDLNLPPPDEFGEENTNVIRKSNSRKGW